MTVFFCFYIYGGERFIGLLTILHHQLKNKQIRISSKSVAISTGDAPHTQLDLEDDNVLMNLMMAIIKHENGKQPYLPEDIKAAIQC